MRQLSHPRNGNSLWVRGKNNCTVNSEECLQNDKLGDNKIANYYSGKFKYFNSYNSHCLSSLLNEKTLILIWSYILFCIIIIILSLI